MRSVLLIFALLAAAPLLAAQPVLYHDAVVHTVDNDAPAAGAFVVDQGRFVAVGDEAELAARFPEAARRTLGGATVVPGLIDAHAHLFGLGESLMSADLVGTASAADVVARLQTFEREMDLPAGAWLTGRGWDQNDWPGDGAFPTRADLDAAFPNRPVWLGRVDGHAGWANTAALRAAGIDPEAAAPAAPEGGKVLQDADGRPTGVFVDAAETLITPAMPAMTDADHERALRLGLAAMAEAGLTGVHDAGLTLAQIRTLQRAADEGWLTARVYAMIGGDGPALDHFCQNGLLLGYGDGRVTVRSLKLYVDGALGSRGAALLDEYSDDPGNHGLLMMEPAAYGAVVRRAMGCGLQVNSHAIGDRGGRVVLDAYAAAMAAHPDHAGRHRMEHAQVLADAEIARFAPLGVIASVQPTHATSDMPWAEGRVGARIAGAYAWRRLLDGGARLALGSDFPVERVSPMLGFYAAVTRQDAAGMPEGGWRAGEVLTRAEALQGFTLDAAYAAFQEDQLGSIAVGKRADFVVLDRDPMTTPADGLLATQVQMTVVGGEVVFRAASE